MTVRVFFFIAYTGGVLKGMHSLTKPPMTLHCTVPMENAEGGSRTTLWPSQWPCWDLALRTARTCQAQVHMEISQVCSFSCGQLRESLEQITVCSVPRESCSSAELNSVESFSFFFLLRSSGVLLANLSVVLTDQEILSCMD